ncbi:acetyltransferase [Nocardia sp. NEAU-351]|uniref:Acetyltransferase n=1 Tax=Nocardia bovistercoris TaxID=2785916 RepID=A0A931IDY6_9NOCA|nr:acetyltransferase [Nocardia bovistercoris]
MRTPPPTEPFQTQGVATGISVTAAILLLVLAAVSILEGVSAIGKDEIYVTGVSYIYEFDTTTWGWIHLVLGVIGVICALGLMFGTTWGRYAAVGIAALVIVANFLSLPYYPAWSLLIIALSVVVIWAVTTWHPAR